MAAQPPAAQHRPSETKLILRSLNFARVSEAQRLARAVAANQVIDMRLFYGPVTIESVSDGADGNVKVDFAIRLRMEGDFLTLDVGFEGYVIFVGTDLAGVEAQQQSQAVAEVCAPYIQEIVAYVTGRAGINPVIVPIGGEAVRIQPVQEQA